MRKLTATFSFLAMLFSSAVAAQGLHGEWKGIVTLTCRADKCDTLVVAMQLEGRSGSTQYPGTDCTWRLTFEKKVDNAYYYREQIAAGTCTDGAVVTVQPDGQSLHWMWTSNKQCFAGTLDGKHILPSCSDCIHERDQCLQNCAGIIAPNERDECKKECSQEFPCIKGNDCQ